MYTSYWKFFIFIINFVNQISQIIASVNEEWKTEKWGLLPQDPSNILNLIYYRYANKTDGMTSEQFGSIVKCIRGQPCSIPSAPQGVNPFNLLRNCSLISGSSQKACNIHNQCPNASAILASSSKADVDPDGWVTLEQFKEMAPLLLYQAFDRTCEEDGAAKHNKKPSSAEVWLYAIAFVTLISVCSLVGVSVLPLMASDFYQKLLTVLIGLAVGSLAGSAVFHLIPQAFGIIGDSGNHDYLFYSLAVLFGIWMFFMIERILKLIAVRQSRTKTRLGGSVSSQAICGAAPAGPNSHANRNQESYRKRDEDGNSPENSPKSRGQGLGCGSSAAANNVKLIYESQEQAIKASFGHQQKPSSCHEEIEVRFRQGEDSVIATVAWMIIFGDGFHNFIDGVSIGAAFQQSTFTGISISLAIMCEELPHELGDFAVLLNSGMTMKQALFYNFLSATTCYAGMVVGILLGEFTENSTYIFALAAGMFLYISLVDMVPEMNETASRAAKDGTWSTVVVLFCQNIGMFAGVFSLFFLAYYQDKIAIA